MTELVYDDPNKCVKDNPELGPCMCPTCMKALQGHTSDYIQKGIVLTDDALVSKEPVSMVSYHFKCGECGCTYVADYMLYCPNCGVRLILRSHKVMEFLRNHMAKNLL